MALTNYLSQSIVMILLFNGYGGRLDRPHRSDGQASRSR